MIGQVFQSNGSRVGTTEAADAVESGLATGVIGDIGLGLRVGVAVGNRIAVGSTAMFRGNWSFGIVGSSWTGKAFATQAVINTHATKRNIRFIKTSIFTKVNGK
jgi:hypothetical protein